ncbi:MAG: 50S ribosomal protein L29 [Candidatus Saccharimonadales bacterium]
MMLADLRKESTTELEKLLAKTQGEWLEFMTDVRTKEVSDNRRGRKLRRDIARIKTVIREKELN